MTQFPHTIITMDPIATMEGNTTASASPLAVTEESESAPLDTQQKKEVENSSELSESPEAPIESHEQGENDDTKDEELLDGLEDITKAIDKYEQEERALQIVNDLKKYIDLLPHAPSSFNALLDAEHNGHDDKAQSLVDYYEERPELFEYTRSIELPRMDYIWISPTGEFIQDKERIANLLEEASRNQQHYILARCANQSLLADLLQFLTAGDDNALIRRQYHMAVHTKKVSIVVMPSNGTVLAKANLELSLPHPSQGLVNIATVHVSCQFSPLQTPPMFHYHVETVRLSDSCPNESELLDMAYFLQDLPSQLTIEEEEAAASSFNHNARDAFLQRTKTSWKQMNSHLANTLLFRNGTESNPSDGPRRFQKSQEGIRRQISRIKSVVSNRSSTVSQPMPTEESEEIDFVSVGANAEGVTASFKRQQESFRRQLSRLKSGSDRDDSSSSTDMLFEPAHDDSTKAASTSTASTTTTSQSLTPPQPVRRQKRETLQNKIHNLKSAVLEKAGSRAQFSGKENTVDNTVVSTTEAISPQPPSELEKPRWTGRLRSGWNRLAQAIPANNKAQSNRRNFDPTAEEGDVLVFSSTSTLSSPEKPLFQSPAKEAATSSSSPPVPAPSTSAPTRDTTRRWNKPGRFSKFLKIAS